jgi:CRISPR system Cascade subunit CasE
MTLYLSRIQLNPMSGKAIALVGDINKLHQAIYSLFTPEDAPRILFRVDVKAGHPQILIQSPTTPTWSNLALQPQDLLSPPASKELALNFDSNSEFSFRLLARPSKRTSSGTGNKPGKRCDLRSDQERLEWLKRKAESSGFCLISCELTTIALPFAKPVTSQNTKTNTFNATQFDGTLLVIDPSRFAEALAHGFGPQKAFGFGMLSLAKG